MISADGNGGAKETHPLHIEDGSKPNTEPKAKLVPTQCKKSFPDREAERPKVSIFYEMHHAKRQRAPTRASAICFVHNGRVDAPVGLLKEPQKL
eukprot:9495957-Pyramimonas_sp.AAC.1